MLFDCRLLCGQCVGHGARLAFGVILCRVELILVVEIQIVKEFFTSFFEFAFVLFLEELVDVILIAGKHFLLFVVKPNKVDSDVGLVALNQISDSCIWIDLVSLVVDCAVESVSLIPDLVSLSVSEIRYQTPAEKPKVEIEGTDSGVLGNIVYRLRPV